ncbi:hypothetical protein HA402_015999 [Bradysia odoriphaga]|nr:hypothetical protein HA402_015999 [Bradysia odoriphaga]
MSYRFLAAVSDSLPLERLLQAKKANGSMSSPQSIFHRNIRNHSTPVIGNGGNATSRLTNSNKKKGKKRKLVDDIIDLTPKKYRTSSDDSDIEIIEPEPPTIIDLATDDTYNCNALTTVNATADTVVAASDCQESENKSSDTAVNVIIDSAESIDLAETSNEVEKVIDQPDPESVPLYVVCKDASANDSIKPPLYDLVSDDSFCFDSPYATPVSSQDFSFSRFATPLPPQDISQNKTLTNSADDSVVFVSETLQTPKRVPPAWDFIPIMNRGRPIQTSNRVGRADDYIPINNGGGSKKRKKSRSPRQNSQKRRSPKKTQTSSNNQIPATQTSTTPTNPKPISGIKRMVLIDGSNVAFGHSRNKGFSVEGIEICLNYFLERGYEAKAIVPQMRLKKAKSSNTDLLAKLESEGKVVFSPCKNLPSGQKVTSYDDRFIMDFAVDCDAAVISNDNYRDLSKENEKYREVVNTRVIGFTFLNDIIRFPQDPYGKFGPSLTEILDGKEK